MSCVRSSAILRLRPGNYPRTPNKGKGESTKGGPTGTGGSLYHYHQERAESARPYGLVT